MLQWYTTVSVTRARERQNCLPGTTQRRNKSYTVQYSGTSNQQYGLYCCITVTHTECQRIGRKTNLTCWLKNTVNKAPLFASNKRPEVMMAQKEKKSCVPTPYKDAADEGQKAGKFRTPAFWNLNILVSCAGGGGVYLTNHFLRDPLPEDDIVGHRVGLHLGLHLDVENLQRFLSWKNKQEYKVRFSGTLKWKQEQNVIGI